MCISPTTLLAESARGRDTRKYQTEHGVALLVTVAVVQLPESHPGLRTWRKYHDQKLLLGRLISQALTRVTFAPRRDEKRFLPKSIPRQNGAGYPPGGEKRGRGGGKRDPRWPASLLNTCLCMPAANKWAHDGSGNFSGSVKLGREDGKLIWRLS